MGLNPSPSLAKPLILNVPLGISMVFKTSLDYEVNERLALFGELGYRDENNTNGCYDYERSIIMLGEKKSYF